MSTTIASLRRKIGSAGNLHSVVSAMKALAASSIGQYEQSVRSLAGYEKSVELGLGVCFRLTPPGGIPEPAEKGAVIAIVYGSDQGLVGRFNDHAVEHASKVLLDQPVKPRVLAVGERVHERLADAGLDPAGRFPVPNSVNGIAPLIGRILSECGQQIGELHLFHNSPTTGAVYETVHQRLLPLDDVWRGKLMTLSWPTKNPPQILGGNFGTLRAFISEYLFVSLFKACAESLASENASRLAAMQRADRNIGELLEDLNRTFRRLRQSGIDEELFDLITGFEALLSATAGKARRADA